MPRPVDELLAAELVAIGALFVELAFDHHLRGDAGVIHARLPQRVAAAHALEPDEHILQRVVERVAHVQRARDVGRRDDDGVGLAGVGAPGGKRALFFPALVMRAFDVFGLIGFGERHGALGSVAGWRAVRGL